MCAASFVIPSRPRGMLALAPAVLVAWAATGCQSASQEQSIEQAAPAERPAKTEIGWEERPLGGVASGVAEPVPVKEGPAPLVYLTERGVTVRIVDRAGGGGDKVLAETAVPGRTIVRVDARAGVVIGKQTLVGGPLPAGRRYAILIVPQGESVSRVGRTRPVEEPPPPQQAPAEDAVQERVVDPTGTGGGIE